MVRESMLKECDHYVLIYCLRYICYEVLLILCVFDYEKPHHTSYVVTLPVVEFAYVINCNHEHIDRKDDHFFFIL